MNRLGLSNDNVSRVVTLHIDPWRGIPQFISLIDFKDGHTELSVDTIKHVLEECSSYREQISIDHQVLIRNSQRDTLLSLVDQIDIFSMDCLKYSNTSTDGTLTTMEEYREGNYLFHFHHGPHPNDKAYSYPADFKHDELRELYLLSLKMIGHRETQDLAESQ
jgi:hypothetical protein